MLDMPAALVYGADMEAHRMTAVDFTRATLGALAALAAGVVWWAAIVAIGSN